MKKNDNDSSTVSKPRNLETGRAITHTIDLFQAMHEGAVVLTPNNRLSQHLLLNYGKLYRQPHQGPLVKPQCLSYESWLQQVYHHLIGQISHPTPNLLISNHQERFLWKKILQESSNHPVSNELVTRVQDAWLRCVGWEIAYDHPALQHNPHTRQFQRWYHLFINYLSKINAITVAQLPHYMLNAEWTIPDSPIIWTCFDEFTPLQKRLQQTLQQQGCAQLFDDYQEKPINGYCFSAKDEPEELQQAILWARQQLHAGDEQIAIIIPELQNHIQTIQRLLDQAFEPNLYNLSYGQPLLEYPIVNTAIQLLALDGEQINSQQIQLLLQSPFIAHGFSEFSERSHLLQNSRLMTVSTLAWSDFLAQIKASVPGLYQNLVTVTPYPQSASPYAWTQQFKQRLHLLGFPGQVEINSNLYQCLNRFHLLFDELMSLNVVSASLSVQDALQAIRELSAAVVFQVQKPPTPITVLGLLEASGCRYDSIWISHLTEQYLPKKTNFSPFIPIYFQKNLGMPHSDAGKEYERAQLGLRRLGYACQHIVYSYPSSIGDEPQSPSTLIGSFPNHALIPTHDHNQVGELESYSESYVHPPKPHETISGGTAALASQAKCPFQAFAAHRLKIKVSPSTQDGLDLSERGQILHRVMEILWGQLHNQTTLLRQSTEQLKTIIQRSIERALAAYEREHPATLSRLTQEVEYVRLSQLIHACLAWERQRTPFEIMALEQAHQLSINGLPIQIRVDRLDHSLLDGHQIVIDYKTSLPSSKPWLESRPESPQLLVYALLDPKIKTLVFLQMKAGKIVLQGLSAEPTEEAGIQVLDANETWSMYRQHWEQELNLLADELKAGRCEPKPKRSSLCLQCAYPSLCRL